MTTHTQTYAVTMNRAQVAMLALALTNNAKAIWLPLDEQPRRLAFHGTYALDWLAERGQPSPAYHADQVADVLAQHAPYQPGGALAIREHWRPHVAGVSSRITGIEYQAGLVRLYEMPQAVQLFDANRAQVWRDPANMPDWACRFWFTIGSVRAVRLLDLTTQDAREAGHLGGLRGPLQAAIGQWDSLYAASGLAHRSNPWLWVLGVN